MAMVLVVLVAAGALAVAWAGGNTQVANGSAVVSTASPDPVALPAADTSPDDRDAAPAETDAEDTADAEDADDVEDTADADDTADTEARPFVLLTGLDAVVGDGGGADGGDEAEQAGGEPALDEPAPVATPESQPQAPLEAEETTEDEAGHEDDDPDGDDGFAPQPPPAGFQPSPGGFIEPPRFAGPEPVHHEPVDVELIPSLLELVAEVIETPTPEPADPFELEFEGGGAADQLTGNAVGCASDCITSALLYPQISNANLRLDVSTSIATGKAVWILPPVPFFNQGKFAHELAPPVAVSGEAGHQWETMLTLVKDQSYRIVLMVTDQYGESNIGTAVFTAQGPADDLVSPGGPCAFACIEFADVTPGPTFDRARLHARSNADVEWHVAGSASTPGSIGGNPFLPENLAFGSAEESSTEIVGDFTGLAPDTTYYVVLKATDSQGFRHYAVGSFTTLPEPPPEPEPREVLVWVERAHIHQTGDGNRRGEISFFYGLADGHGYSNYYVHWAGEGLQGRIINGHQGESVPLGGGSFTWENGDGFLPPVVVEAQEYDGGNLRCEVTEADGPDFALESGPGDCENHVTVAWQMGITVDWINTLPTCDAYGMNGFGATTDRCYVLKSPNPGPEYVQFDALIVFRVMS